MIIVFSMFSTVALNIEKNPQRTSKIKSLIDQYNWNKINFASHSKGWKKLQQNNKKIAINILFVPYKNYKIRLAYK